MDEIAITELIVQTKDSIRSFEYSQATVDRYQMAWRALTDYFIENNQVMFSQQLAEQYVLQSKTKLDAGVIKRWRYQLDRLTVRMQIEYFEYGSVSWKKHEDDHSPCLRQSAFILLHTDYLNYLKKEGKSADTIQTRERVCQGNFWNTWNRGKSGILRKFGGTRSVPLSLLFRNITSQPIWERLYRICVLSSGLLSART